MTPLQYVCELETFRDVLAGLTPKQFVVVALRLDGLNLTQIGQALGINRQHVQARLRSAERRLLKLAPHLAEDAGDRRRTARSHKPHHDGPLTAGQMETLAAIDHLTEMGLPACPVFVDEYLGRSSGRTHLRRLYQAGWVERGPRVGPYQTYCLAEGVVVEQGKEDEGSHGCND